MLMLVSYALQEREHRHCDLAAFLLGFASCGFLVCAIEVLALSRMGGHDILSSLCRDVWRS